MFGRLDETSEADARRLSDVNFWSIVSGSLIALPYLKQNGGALINLVSEVAEGSAPLQGMYGATKHAVKGFNNALRIEVEEVDKAPVAEAILKSATDPERFVRVGPVSKMDTLLAKFMPAMGDKMSAMQTGRQQYDEAPRNPEGALYEASAATGVVGQTHGTGGESRG